MKTFLKVLGTIAMAIGTAWLRFHVMVLLVWWFLDVQISIMHALGLYTLYIMIAHRLYDIPAKKRESKGYKAAVEAMLESIFLSLFAWGMGYVIYFWIGI